MHTSLVPVYLLAVVERESLLYSVFLVTLCLHRETLTCSNIYLLNLGCLPVMLGWKNCLAFAVFPKGCCDIHNAWGLCKMLYFFLYLCFYMLWKDCLYCFDLSSLTVLATDVLWGRLQCFISGRSMTDISKRVEYRQECVSWTYLK